ncbi:hypothetical protein [Rhodopila sp.]|uniref:hypothetical protein n=1 Tax=Rhodopila sp. TaxID=2480087 RepID=UPI003D09EE4B
MHHWTSVAGQVCGPGRRSPRAIGSHATEAGIADLCDVSLPDRLRNSGDFLADVLDRLLADHRGDAPTEGRLSGSGPLTVEHAVSDRRRARPGARA